VSETARTEEVAVPESGRWPDGVSVEAAEAPDGRRRITITNDSEREHHFDLAPADGCVFSELEPVRGRLWAQRTSVQAHCVQVLTEAPEASLEHPFLTGATGVVDDYGNVISAGGRPGSVARVEIRLPGGARRRTVLVFAKDTITTQLTGWRDLLGHRADLSSVSGDVTVLTEWRPGSTLSAAEQPRLTMSLRAPATATVTVDGTRLAGHRTNDSTVTADLTELRSRADDWTLRIDATDVPLGGFTEVFVSGVPPRWTEHFDEVRLPNYPWLQQPVDGPTDTQLAPGFTVSDLLLANRHRDDPPGVEFDENVVYGRRGDTELVGSVYRRRPLSPPGPAVVLVHGGGWFSGDRGLFHRHAQLFAEHGWTTLNIEYGLHPDVRWADSLGDVKCAVRWIRSHAGELNVDPSRIAIVGASAGGQLAAMVAATPGQFEGDSGWPDTASAVSAVGLLYPAVDLVDGLEHSPGPITAAMRPYFGADLALASPTNHVDAQWPPVLTISGSADPLIRVSTLTEFHARLDAAAVPNQLILYPGRRHGFDLYGSDWDSAAATMLDFLNRTT